MLSQYVQGPQILSAVKLGCLAYHSECVSASSWWLLPTSADSGSFDSSCSSRKDGAACGPTTAGCTTQELLRQTQSGLQCVHGIPSMHCKHLAICMRKQAECAYARHSWLTAWLIRSIQQHQACVAREGTMRQCRAWGRFSCRQHRAGRWSRQCQAGRRSRQCRDGRLSRQCRASR